MTGLSLFSGIGGMDLAFEAAGGRVAAMCEIDEFCRKVLRKHWPNVPIYEDIRTLRGDEFGAVDVVFGGFPCQPFSVAGKQEGRNDDRYLWPEFSRLVEEIGPSWVVAENVPGILSLAADDVCQDLERLGYEVGIWNFEAAAVGSPHRRARIFFVGHADRSERKRDDRRRPKSEGSASGCQSLPNPESIRWQGRCDTRGCGEGSGKRVRSEFGRIYSIIPAPDCERCEEQRSPISAREEFRSFECCSWRSPEPGLGGMVDGLPPWLDGAIWWGEEPDIPRVARGVSARVQRLKALGNAVVPAQIYPIFRAIIEIERSERG